MRAPGKLDFLKLREALEASWCPETSYLGVWDLGNRAKGQCYPTSRAVQSFFPEFEIIKGEVWDGNETNVHFWNGLPTEQSLYHVDLSWQQFSFGSSVRSFDIINRDELGDSAETIERCNLLLEKVRLYLGR